MVYTVSLFFLTLVTLILIPLCVDKGEMKLAGFGPGHVGQPFKRLHGLSFCSRGSPKKRKDGGKWGLQGLITVTR